MSIRWQKTLTMACLAFAIAGGTVACAVSPEPTQDLAAADRAPRAQPAVIPVDPGGDDQCVPDSNESNDEAEDATGVDYSWSFYYSAEDTGSEELGAAGTPSVGGTICEEDEDWYHIPTASLPYTVRWVPIRVIAAGASFCPGENPPAGPQNTVQVEVYNASTLQLLGSKQSTIGRVFLDLWGGPLNDDLYVRIHGPAQAHYGYYFQLRAQSDAFEDECES